jgi:hypothetical protein
MYCTRCGTDLPAGSESCPSCGFVGRRATSHGGAPGRTLDSLEEALREAQRATKDLAVATARLSKRAATRAGAAAKDPAGTTKRVTARLKKEIDEAVSDLTETLRKL